MRTSASAVPGRAKIVKVTSSSVSAMICKRGPMARESRVAGIEPSTELSIGTTAPSTCPARIRSSAAPWLGAATRSTGPSKAPEFSNFARAISVKVPDGPKYAIRGTLQL